MHNCVGVRLILCAALSLSLIFPLAGYAQQAPAKTAVTHELIAVLDLEAVGASAVQASTMTERLREELLKSGKFTLVDRAQMDAVLKEQALQQTGCTSQECAVQTGKVLGVRKIVSGKVSKVDDTHWLLSATMVDVETSQTLRAESVRYTGEFFSMLESGISQLADKLAGGIPAKPGLDKLVAESNAAAKPPAPGESAVPEKKGISIWWWVLGGVVILGAAAAGSSGGSKASPPAAAPANPTTTVHVSW